MAKHKSNVKAIVTTLIILAVIGLFFYAAGRNTALDTVKRTINKDIDIAKSEQLTITYTYQGSEPQWAVEETLPVGWNVVGPTQTLGAVSFSTYTSGSNKVLRFMSDSTAKTVGVYITAPSTISTTDIIFNGGKWWSYGFTAQQQIPSITVKMQGCTTPLLYDTTAPLCQLLQPEWIAFRTAWIAGTETFDKVITYGNIYFNANAGRYTN